jgi:phosphoribosylformylglycinamidine synthase
MAALFAEELSIVIEVAPENVATVAAAYAAAGVTATPIGTSTADGQASITVAVGCV